MQTDELDPEKIMEDYVRNRGDIFEEWHFMVRHVPLTIVRLHDISGYILKHENKTAPDQELSFVFRELIALCQLSTKGEPRFAANHVRRLYRAGITNTVIFEAAEAFSTAVGHANIALVAQSILLANDPAYPFGKLPEGGEPKSVTPFPEMELGWEAERAARGRPPARPGLAIRRRDRPGIRAPHRRLRRPLPDRPPPRARAEPRRPHADRARRALRPRRTGPCGRPRPPRLRLRLHAPAGAGGDLLRAEHDRRGKHEGGAPGDAAGGGREPAFRVRVGTKGTPMMRSSKPSPFTSPAEATEKPLWS